MADPFTILINGDIMGAVIASYTNVLGQMFYGMLVFLGMVMIYMKTQDFGTVGVTGILVASATIAFLPPGIHLIAYVLLALSVTIIFYRVFRK